MVEIKHYGTGQFELAEQRYKIVTKLSSKEFIIWLGFNPVRVNSNGGMGFPRPPFSVTKGMPAHDKMEMLLNDNWYALMKAHLVQHADTDK